MRQRIITILVAVCATAPALLAQTPAGTAFTYQGQLKQNGQPFNGNAAFEFRLYGSEGGTDQIGSTVSIPGQSVLNGLFTSLLDFGAGPFTTAQARWVQVTVNGTPLTPRQRLTPAPFSNATRGIIVDADGDVAIGTDITPARLTVSGHSPIGGLDERLLDLRGVDAGGTPYGLYANLTTGGPFRDMLLTTGDASGQSASLSLGAGDGRMMTINPVGVGINTMDPVGRLHVVSADDLPQNQGGAIWVSGDSNEGRFGIGVNNRGSWIQSHQGKPLGINPAGNNVGIGTDEPETKLHVIGTTKTSILQITGGSDVAEPFAVATPEHGRVEPGMVVAIDPDRAGELKLADEPYDRKVAGIISGANGINSGLVLRQEGTIADGEHPVALTGRVWCWCDASYGAINPGDRLTTSATPGHAMTVTDEPKAPGAVIGKAMTTLESGKGLVLVLVQPQ
ncbi:MAG: hypothetical protein AB7Q17_03305 [Phycisphaerae bacterium]